jgi:TRAP-type transport system small permease protein
LADGSEGAMERPMKSVRSFIDRLCGGVSAAALFGIMVLTFVDVSGRKALSQSVPGSLELTELLMVLVIFAALPLVSLHGEHVVFDSLDAVTPKAWQKWQRALVELICACGLFGVAWLMWRKAGSLAEFGDTTALLKISHAPFVYGMSFLAALTGVVHLMLMLNPVPTHHVGVDMPEADVATEAKVLV